MKPISIDILKSLLSSKPSAAEIQSALSGVPAVSAAACAERDGLQTKRRSILLTGSDADIVALDMELASVNYLIERIEAMREALEVKLEATLDADTLTQALAERERVMKIRDQAAQNLAAKWPKLAQSVVNLIREIAEADDAVAGFNNKIEKNGVDLDPLIGAEETIRQRPSLRAEIISTEIVEKLITSDGGTFEGSLSNAKFDKDRGGYCVKSYDGGHPYEEIVFKRRFRKETVLPPAHAPFAQPLWAALSLPALVAGDRDFWRPTILGSGRAAASFFEAEEQIKAFPEAAKIVREPQVRFIPLADDEISAI